MTMELHKWRMSDAVATLPRNSLPMLGIPPVVQYFPRDYADKTDDSEGGKHRQGFMTYELLWTRVDPAQLSAIQRIFNNVIIGIGDLYFTGLWWDSANPVVRWVDMSGKPDLSDPTPNPPAFAYGIQIFSNLTLKLNNVALIQDPAEYL